MKQVTEWESVPILFDVPMAARLLGLVPETVYRWCKKGILPAVRIGEEWRFEKNAFIEYIRKNNVMK